MVPEIWQILLLSHLHKALQLSVVERQLSHASINHLREKD